MKKYTEILRKILFMTSVMLFFAVLSDGGEILTDTLFSSMPGEDWPVRVWLPDGYDADSENLWPVLFLLHGSGGDIHDWDFVFPLMDSLIREKIIAPFVAVSPASGTSWWVDGKKPFESAFIRELIPYVTEKFNLSHNRDFRCIAGFSMGGYGALRYGLMYPELFGSAILLSPAIYNSLPPKESSARSSGAFGNPFRSGVWKKRNYPAILPDYLKKGNPVFFFIGAGDDDWNHPEGFQYNVEQQAVLLYGIMNKKHKIPAELRIVNGGHNWKLWKPLLVEGLKQIPDHSPGFSVSQP